MTKKLAQAVKDYLRGRQIYGGDFGGRFYAEQQQKKRLAAVAKKKRKRNDK